MEFTLYVILLFLTFGLSSLGIITSYRLKSNQSIAYASSLFYWSAFTVSFGYYGIWGVIFFRYLALSSEISFPLIENLISVIPALGAPLLLVSWFLLIRFSLEYSGKNFPRLLTVLYFAIAIPLLAVFLFIIKINLPAEDFSLEKLHRYLLIVHLVFILASSIILFQTNSDGNKHHSPSILIMSILTPAIMLLLSFIFRYSHWSVVPAFVLFYFIYPAFLPAIIYFKIGDFEVRREKNNGFEIFCDRYEISKREAEIVEQICKGKTNKEIAESLFISLQTVKDHASRIYLKTAVSNRVQLSNLVLNYLKYSSDMHQNDTKVS